MHTWSDETVDWNGINDAARYIGQTLRKRWRVGVRDYKEKFGTVRVYCSLGWHQFHCITHPGHVYNRWPKWLWRLDCHYGWRVCHLLNYIVVPVHCWAYRRAYQEAIRRWPHLRLEILHGADYTELLAPLGVHRVRTGKNSYEIHIDWSEHDYVRPPEMYTDEDEGTETAVSRGSEEASVTTTADVSTVGANSETTTEQVVKEST